MPELSVPPIALLTDYGYQDAYVGLLHAVIRSLRPQAAIIDLHHEVPRQDVRAGALVLAGAAPYLPLGTIVVGVVDPGVGGPRRAIATHGVKLRCVGPDNGLFSLLHRFDPPRQAIELDESRYHRQPVSHTFHGRDIFAPVAAHLANDEHLGRLGSPLDPASLIRLELPVPQRRDQELAGEILYVDGFGNLISNVDRALLREWAGDAALQVRAGADRIPVGTTFSSVPPGASVAYLGSGGYLEIAVRDGDASSRLDLSPGDPITIRIASDQTRRGR